MIDFTQIRKLIGEGQAQKAIDQLMTFLETSESKKRKIRDQIVVLDSQLSDIKNKRNLNLIDEDKYQRETSQINYALLDIINALETGKSKLLEEPTSRSNWIYFLAIALIGLISYVITITILEKCGDPIEITLNESSRKYGLKKCNKWIGERNYNIIRPFSEGRAAAQDEEVWGYIDTTGETVLPFKYSQAESFKEGKALVEEKGRFFFIDTLGNCIQNCFRGIQDTVFVKGGGFEMGTSSLRDFEKPAHWVTLNDFYIDRNEVTNEQYSDFLNAVGYFKKEWINLDGELNIEEKTVERSRIQSINKQFEVQPGHENHPVNFVSWEGAYAYAKYYGMRLPTEAEWEYAALGGQEGIINDYQFSGSNDLDQVSWNWTNSGDQKLEGEWQLARVYSNNNRIHPVKTKKANGLGLFDMSGNVYEWCADYYAADYYQNSPVANPLNSTDGGWKTARGGNVFLQTEGNLIKHRGFWTPKDWNAGIGFRCVKDVEQ